MAIGVEGQYYFSVSLEGRTDFIAEDKLEFFQLVEECGNVLPTFLMKFLSPLGELIQKFREGTKIKVKFGRAESEAFEGELRVLKSNRTRRGEDWLYSVWGSGALPDYVHGTYYKFPKKKQTALEKAEEVLTEFGFDVKKVPWDKGQEFYWMAGGRTHRDFVSYCVENSELGKDDYGIRAVASIHIDWLGGVRIVNLKDLIGKSMKFPDWTMSTQAKKSKDHLVLATNFSCGHESGFMGGLGLWGLVNSRVSLDDSSKSSHWGIVREWPSFEVDSYPEKLTSFNSRRLDKQDLGGSRVKRDKFRMVNLLNSTARVVAGYSAYFKETAPLDVVDFSEPLPDPGNGGLEEFTPTSGLYLITKVSRTIEYRTLRTVLEMVRPTIKEK